MTINGSSAANITVHRLRWGRASLEVTVLEAGGAYRNVTHLLRQAISCSPSLTLGAADEPEGDGAAAAGELTARDGAPIANLLDRSNFSLSLAALYTPKRVHTNGGVHGRVRAYIHAKIECMHH